MKRVLNKVEEYLEHEYQYNQPFDLSLDNNYFIMIDLSNTNFDFKKIKGITQSSKLFNKNRSIEMAIGNMDYDLKELLNYSLLLHPFRLSASLIYTIRHDTYFEDYAKILDLFFGENNDESDYSDNLWNELNFTYLNLCFTFWRSNKFYDYFIEKLKSNSTLKSIKLQCKWSDDIYPLMKAIKSNKSLKYVKVEFFIESNVDNLMKSINEFNQTKGIYIDYFIKKYSWRTKRKEKFLDKYGLEIE